MSKHMEKPNIRKKKKKITTCSLSSFSGPLYGSIFFGGVFSRFLPPCQSKSVSCLFCCVFLFSWCLGEISPWQTSIGKAFTLAHLHWCLHWVTDFGYWAIRENVEETMTLSPTSSGLRHSTVLMFFFGMPMFWFLIFRGLIHVLWSCDIYVA